MIRAPSHKGSSDYRFNLAGVEVALVIVGELPEFIGNYQDYPSLGCQVALRIEVELQADYPTRTPNPSYPGFETLKASDLGMSLSRMDTHGDIETPDRGPIVARFCSQQGVAGLEAIIRICLSVALPAKGGLILHSSAIANQGRSWVFSGRSGAGKSTISSILAESCAVRKLADDLLVVRKINEQWHTYVTPFTGVGMAEAGESHPLASLNMIVQAKRHQRLRLSSRDAMGEMCRHVVSYTRSSKTSSQVLQLVADLVESTPCYRLWFARDRSVREVLGITC